MKPPTRSQDRCLTDLQTKKKCQPLRFSTANRLPRCPRCISLLPDIAVAVDPRQHPQVGRRTKIRSFSCQDSLLWDVFMVVYDLRPNQKLCAMFSIDHPRFCSYQILTHTSHTTDILPQINTSAERRHPTLLMRQHAVQVSHLGPIFSVPDSIDNTKPLALGQKSWKKVGLLVIPKSGGPENHCLINHISFQNCHFRVYPISQQTQFFRSKG